MGVGAGPLSERSCICPHANGATASRIKRLVESRHRACLAMHCMTKFSSNSWFGSAAAALREVPSDPGAILRPICLGEERRRILRRSRNCEFVWGGVGRRSRGARRRRGHPNACLLLFPVLLLFDAVLQELYRFFRTARARDSELLPALLVVRHEKLF